MKLPSLFQFRILKLAVQSLLTPAVTTKFPQADYEPIPEFRGRPRYSQEDCIGCGACAAVCPADCIDVLDEPGKDQPTRTLTQHLDACICCGQCERYCTSETGIKLTNEFDFVGFAPEDFEEKVEKELLLCESCGAVIAPQAQLAWLVKRLGPLAYANPTLMLTALKELQVVAAGVKITSENVQRGQHLNIQCPQCRRQTSFAV
ncbi:4Fe-4S dicluster domain-containing protein [bacterium]|nr:4Fe-4S dicluster domain-containing protein [bacterium]